MKLNKLIPLNDDLYTKLLMFFLVVMIVAIPFSRFLMSVSQFGFAGIWLLHGRIGNKLQSFIKSPAAIILTSIYVLHIIGIAWSTDLNYALKDIRIKLPILIIPFMFIGFPKINHKQFKILVYFFVASVVFVSVYLTIAHYATSVEIKQILHEYFISHIRYSLSLNLALFFLLFVRLEDPKRGWIDFISALVLLWLLGFIFFLEAFTGVIVFFTLIFVTLTYSAIKTGIAYKKLIYFSFILIGAVSIVIYLFSFFNQYHTLEKIDNLDKYTVSGNKYSHKPELGTENGKYIFIYVSYKELREAWNKRSKIQYDSLDLQGQKIKFTLIRYLTSKNLRKDKEGVIALNNKDIQNIERGIANYHYTKGLGVESRLMKIMFEYDNYIRTGDPSGHSVMQRVEYWKTSWSIIKKNFWLGVGTGDLNIAFEKEYEILDSKLSEKSRLRSHNQYLSIWVGLGFIGLLWFLFAILYPALKLNGFNNYYFTLFFITFVVSMLTEDTIETQAGVTFFIFFTSLFLLLNDRKSLINNEKD